MRIFIRVETVQGAPPDHRPKVFAVSQVPRVELTEMGPRLDLSVRRRREAPPDLAKEALRQPKLTGKKVCRTPCRAISAPVVGRLTPPWKRTKSLMS